MTDQELESLRYPVGRANPRNELDPEERQNLREVLRQFPEKVKNAISHLDDEQLDTPYRPGGWSIRQVVHHVVDSHMNSYVRFRWALTEDKPLIKAYDEKAWALLPDAASAPVSISVDLLAHLHTRWLVLLDNMSEEDYAKELEHPVAGTMSMNKMLDLYAWHCNHHLAHITELKERENWG